MVDGIGRTGFAAATAWLALLLAGQPAAAQASDAGTFRIGMVAQAGGTPAVEGLSAIRAAFSGALGMPVEVFVARDYAALIEAHVAGRVDYAVYSAVAYAAASIRCGCVQPVAAPVDADGAVGLRSVLILRRGAPEGGEAAGRIAVGPADSLAARLVPLASWPQAAAAQAQGGLVAAGSVSAAEAMFLDGEVDGFFGWARAWPGDDAGAAAGGSPARLRAAGLDGTVYEIGWRSPVLRYGPHAVRADLPAERVALLAGLLQRAGADDAELSFHLGRDHGGGFAAASHDDYAAVVEALEALGAGE